MQEHPCLRCGACCHQRPGTILVTQDDIDQWRRKGLHHLIESLTEGHFGQWAFPIGPNGACVYLGVPGAPNDCSIHPDRAAVCRDFQPGSPQCLEFIRDRERAIRWLAFRQSIRLEPPKDTKGPGWAMHFGIDQLRRSYWLDALPTTTRHRR